MPLAPSIRNIYINLSQQASIAMRLSATDNNQSPAIDMVANDIEQWRIRFYEEDSSGALTLTSLDNGTDVIVGGKGIVGGVLTTLIYQDSFTKVSVAAAVAADGAGIAFTGNLSSGNYITLTDTNGTTKTFQASASPADGNIGFVYSGGESATTWMNAFVTAVNAAAIYITATNDGDGTCTLAQDLAGAGGNTTITASGANITIESSFSGGLSADTYYYGTVQSTDADFTSFIGSDPSRTFSAQIQLADAVGGGATSRKTVSSFSVNAIADMASDGASTDYLPGPMLTSPPDINLTTGVGDGYRGQFYVDDDNLWICTTDGLWRYVELSAFPLPS